MNILYGSEFKTMLPKLKSDNFKGLELIRPLYLVEEDIIEKWRDTYRSRVYTLCMSNIRLQNCKS